MNTVYRDVLLQPFVPCPECGAGMCYENDWETVYCGVPTCRNYRQRFRMVNRPRVDLIHCGVHEEPDPLEPVRQAFQDLLSDD